MIALIIAGCTKPGQRAHKHKHKGSHGKIGVPIGGIEETLIIGDVQIDFILNEDGTLRAKVFNKENEFRYIGDELGYTQGIGLSYQVDFQTFRSLLSKIIANNN